MPSFYLRHTQQSLCEWCLTRPAAHNHHTLHKSQGGTDKGYWKGPDDADAEDPAGPIYLLCVVCHFAAHGIYAIENNFSCSQCRFQTRCVDGQKLLRQRRANASS